MKTISGDKWRSDLENWGIPQEILKQAPSNPWIHPVDLFKVPAEIPNSISHDKAREIKPRTLLDVGCGGGIATFAVTPPVTSVIGIDHQPEMLREYESVAKQKELFVKTIEGFWPDVADKSEKSDVVVCHHVLFNVHNIEEFLIELNNQANQRVVIEIPKIHPQSESNYLWKYFWNLERPAVPTASDIINVLKEIGIKANIIFWESENPRTLDSSKKIEYARIRLCLNKDRDEEIKRVMNEQPIAKRELATIWWDK